MADEPRWIDCGNGIRINPVIKWKPDGSAEIACVLPIVQPKLAGKLTVLADGSHKWEPVNG